MSAYRFSSCLAVQMERFVDLRRLSGTDYHSQAQLLGYVDRFLVQQDFCLTYLTREITDRYQQGLTALASRTQGNRMSVLRQFCEYMATCDSQSYVPRPQKTIRSCNAHRTYIYHLSQLQALMAASAGLAPPGSLRPHTYRTLLGLLYSTGIRIGEAMALTLQDVHLSSQRLFIAEGKFRKARWVALSESTGRALGQYIDKRLKTAAHWPDSPLLLNERRRHLCYPTVNMTFRGLLQKCGIAHSKRTGPRIHDLRHTFAVHRLLAWYREGQDVNALLPLTCHLYGACGHQFHARLFAAHGRIARTGTGAVPKLLPEKHPTTWRAVMNHLLDSFIKRFFGHYLPVQKGLSVNTILTYRDAIKLLLCYQRKNDQQLQQNQI